MAFIPTDAKMEAIEKLRSQIDDLLQKLDLQREEGGELRNKLIKSEAENRVKDEYIRSLEQRLMCYREYTWNFLEENIKKETD